MRHLDVLKPLLSNAERMFIAHCFMFKIIIVIIIIIIITIIVIMIIIAIPLHVRLQV